MALQTYRVIYKGTKDGVGEKMSETTRDGMTIRILIEVNGKPINLTNDQLNRIMGVALEK